MSQFGWGLLRWLQGDYVPIYRWDLEGSPYHLLRPDRVLLGMAYVTEPRVRIHYDLLKTQEFLASRGVGGPSAQTISPPTSSGNSRQARASAQGGKPGAPARASKRGSRPRRGSCPKGHYWSYKEKKCLKSKFR